MKKLLIVAMVCALFAPAFAIENVYVTGDIQTIGLRMNAKEVSIKGVPAASVPTAGQDQRGTTNLVLLGIGADLVEDVQAKLTFAHSNIFGESQRHGESVTDIWNKASLAEAYVNISNVFDALEVKVGRQFYGDEKSAVMYFGPYYGYAVGNIYTSLDGVTATYRGENLTLTAAYFSLRNGNVITPVTDINLGGLDLNYKFSEEITANAYVYDTRHEKRLVTDPTASWGFWGVKPTIETDHFKLAAEYARNYGEHEKGWQVKADLAMPLGTDETKVTPRVTYLKSEKGFEAYGAYRPGLMFGTVLGFANNALSYALLPAAVPATVADWEVLNAGLCLKFAGLEKWRFGLDFYTGEINNAFNGNSWEAKVVYNLNNYVAFDLTGAVLTNRKHFTASPTAVQLGMNIKF